MQVFLDSFDYPEYYQYLKGTTFTDNPNIQNNDLILIQRSSHPKFSANEGDVIIHYNLEEGYCCNTITKISQNSPVKKYYCVALDNYEIDAVYEPNIIGKIVGTIEDNVWNQLSLTFWKSTINNLNIKALIVDE